MRINNNLMALNAHRYMSQANQKQSKSLEKLSSGLAINSAADNAAGLAISEKMRAQINGLEQAQSNAQDGISMIQTAEGALQESENILQRMRELAVQSANDTNTAEDRSEIQKEIDQLASEITRISESTEFNTKKLLDGSLSGKLHIGANEGQDLSVAVNAMDAETLKVNGLAGDVVGGDVSSVAFSGTAAALVSGNEITVATSEVTATSADQVTLATGMTIDFSAGDALNGWTIELGTVADGTPESATLDESNKIIIINGDFTSTGFSTTGDIQSAINTALSGSTDTGVASMTVTVGGTVGVGTNGDSAAIQNGTNASYTLTISATGSTTETITGLVATATTASGTGDFAGMEFTLDGALANGQSSAITVTSEGGINVSTQEAATEAITIINDAINAVSAERANLGSIQNRLSHTINNLSTTAENMTASESRIRDVDMAKEMMEYTKLGILQQASQAMLAQANVAPQGVLQLLQ